jgi:hypothetical protein
VPHATLGHYARSLPLLWAVDQLHTVGVASLAAAGGAGARRVRYASHDIAGPLVLEGLWDLQQQRHLPQPGALWVRAEAPMKKPGARPGEVAGG